MVLTPQLPWKRIFKDLWLQILLITIYMAIITAIDEFHIAHLSIPLGLITVPGTVIALILAFRTNSAYDRWWEARKVWGAIVNDSRSWARQVIGFVGTENGEKQNKVREMVYRQIAWNYALTRSLRKQDPLQYLQKILSEQETTSYKIEQNVPNALLQTQEIALRELLEKGWINSFQQVQLDQTLVNLTDSMGMCERIKNTVFPAMYGLLVDLLIYVFILTLPFGLVDNLGYSLIPTAVTIAFAFLVIDRIAIYLQDPFEDQPSDTPMLTLSRTIEINLRQQLGETDLPEKMQPDKGVLM